MVTSTRQPDPPASLPPPPQLSELRGVNDNPPSPYLDGRPPQVQTLVGLLGLCASGDAAGWTAGDGQKGSGEIGPVAPACCMCPAVHFCTLFPGTTLSDSLPPAVLPPLQVLDPQQHQALLQQQGRLGGMANGLGDPSLRGTDSDGSAAAAAADTMQLDVAPMTAAAAEAAVAAQAAAAAAVAPAPPPITAAEAEVAAEFVHSALADEEGSPPGSGAGSSPPAAGGRAPPEQQAQAGAAEPSPVGEWPGQGAIASAAAAAAAAAAEPAADGDAAMAAADGPQQAGAAQAGATAGQPAGEGPSGVTAMDASPAKQQQQQRPGEELQ